MARSRKDLSTIWLRALRRTTRDPSGCWLFNGATNKGYGVIGIADGQTMPAHRLTVLVRDGSLDRNTTVDHRCHDSLTCPSPADCPHRRCINPAHLAVMTRGDNLRRRWERGICRFGHPFRIVGQRANGTLRRECNQCRNARARRARAALRVAS